MGGAYKTSGDSEVEEFDFGRIVFDNTFNIIIAILIIEMLSGIIIDKFGELREKEDMIKEDSLTTCFICGRHRDQLDPWLSKVREDQLKTCHFDSSHKDS